MSLPGLPLLTRKVHDTLRAALRAGGQQCECSLDLELSHTRVGLEAGGWSWQDRHYPWLDSCKERTIYYWTGKSFATAARYGSALIKLVPTSWGPPTFEIDGIKMLPTSRCSPFEDARRKVELVAVRGKLILDTCGGLGYFAGWCLRQGAAQVLSCERNPDVIWLRSLNPWSPPAGGALTLLQTDIITHLPTLPAACVEGILHDPPRFGIAGELYSQSFYDELARVLRRQGRLFHYTGSPNRLTSGRNLAAEVSTRLQRAGFTTRPAEDGILALKR